MTALITGATGFLGRHLMGRLSSLGWETQISNTSIANLWDDHNLHIYNNISFDYIFHLAAHTKAGDYCLHHKAEQFEINQRINSNVLKYWNDHQPQAKMIAMGTSCSYAPDILMSEDNYLIGQPDAGLYTYAMTKRMLLIGLKSYAEQYGLKYMYYVPSTLYGRDFELEDSHFIFDLIKKINSGKNKEADVELWGDGYQKRELIYVNDAINIMLDTLQLENKTINLGTGIEYSIREYADSVSSIIGYDSTDIFYDTTKYVGVRSKRLDTTLLKTVLPDFKFTSLDKALEETIKYYQKKLTE